MSSECAHKHQGWFLINALDCRTQSFQLNAAPYTQQKPWSTTKMHLQVPRSVHMCNIQSILCDSLSWSSGKLWYNFEPICTNTRTICVPSADWWIFGLDADNEHHRCGLTHTISMVNCSETKCEVFLLLVHLMTCRHSLVYFDDCVSLCRFCLLYQGTLFRSNCNGTLMQQTHI